ncbi:hypothetical protein T4D_10774 [Trichinella pseudospiralis]|uniref:PiggyBac transposable element-derived protein domain-containing protein n=1 Tax=Trichinella pseudospiralis TaxID=6337 RepID=A0A0V1FI38_TRIPS|nr:hypothetical protein T4D_10774 [Trichinella pseudospiralis]
MAAFEKDSLKRKADIFLPGFVAQTALAYFSREIADQTFVRCIAPSRKAVKACCPDHCTHEQKALASQGILQDEEELSSVFDTETISDEDDIPLSDFCQISSDESGGENSHTGDQYLSRDGTTSTTELPVASSRRAACNILRTVPISTNRKAVLMQAEHTGLTLVQKKLRHFFGLLLLAGVCRRKREATAELWSTDRPEFQRPRKQGGKAAAVSEVFDAFVKNCKASYVPHGEMWMLCDVRTGYTLCVHIYTGKIGQKPKREQGKRVVLDLARDLGPVYGINIDHYFMSLNVARALLVQRKTLLGTIRPRRKKKERAKLVILLSQHYGYCVSGEETNFKPRMIFDYNNSKGAVDAVDEMLEEHSSTYWPYFRGRLIFKGRNDSNLPCPEASYRTCIQFICQMHTVKVENRFCIECPVTNEE